MPAVICASGVLLCIGTKVLIKGSLFVHPQAYWLHPPMDFDVFRQERARVKYENPKYIKDVVVFTGRRSRHEPYLTNMTGTTLMTFGNNVSFAIVLAMKSGGDFRIAAKACDTVNHKWMRDFMSSFSNITVDKCPFAAGRYKYINMQLPPKNIPIPIADGDYWTRYELYLTVSKEKIVEVETLLHFDSSKKNAKKPKKG